MSRPRQLDDLEWVPIAPPWRGIAKPTDEVNELRGRTTESLNWRVRSNVLSAIQGNIAFTGQNNFTSATNQIKMIASFRRALGVASDKHDIIYVCGKDLRYFQVGTAGSDTLVAANVIPSDTAARMGWVWNTNVLLIQTDANGLWWYHADTRTARKSGVAAPVSGPTLADGGAGVLPAGTYNGTVVYVNDWNHPSDESAVGSVVLGANRQISWTNIPTGPAGTAKRRLYRNAAPSTDRLFVTTINDNVTTTFTDNVAATALGAKVDNDNTLPPDTLRNVAITASRVYLLSSNGTTVFASKIDPFLATMNWEAFPTGLSYEVRGTAGNHAIIPLVGDLFIFSTLGCTRVVGDIATGQVVEDYLPIGLFSQYAWARGPEGIYMIDGSKRLGLFTGREIEYLSNGFQGLLNAMVESCGMSGPDLAYDRVRHAVYMNFGSAAGGNTETIGVDLETREAFRVSWNYDISYFSEWVDNYVGSRRDTCVLRSWKAAEAGSPAPGPINGVDTYSTLYQLDQWSPSPGDEVYFHEMDVLVKGLPRASTGWAPMLKIEWWFDNDSSRIYSEMADMLRAPLVTVPGTAGTMRSIQIVISSSAQSISVRLSTPTTTSLRALGAEIHGIRVNQRLLYPSARSSDRSAER